LPAANLRKILAIKLFVEGLQITFGYARLLRTAFWLRLLRISATFNCRFKDELRKSHQTAAGMASIFSIHFCSKILRDLGHFNFGFRV
jgi:hypothetical protein